MFIQVQLVISKHLLLIKTDLVKVVRDYINKESILSGKMLENRKLQILSLKENNGKVFR